MPDVATDLKKLRQTYPGWSVLPRRERERANMLIRNLSDYLSAIMSQRQEGDVAFLYELNWLLERCLRPISTYEFKLYRTVLERNPISDPTLSKTEKQKRLSLYLSMLRCCREDGDREEWQAIVDVIQSHKGDLSNEQRHRLTYEYCLFSMIKPNPLRPRS